MYRCILRLWSSSQGFLEISLLSLIGTILIFRARESIRDFGVYDCPDELLKEHHQEISAY